MSELKLRPLKDKEPAGSRRYIGVNHKDRTVKKGAAMLRPYRPLREPGGRPRGAMVSGPPGRASEEQERFLAALGMTEIGDRDGTFSDVHVISVVWP